MGLDLAVPVKRSQEDESLASFFRRRVGRQAFERMLEPLMAGIYAGDAEQMSVQATFPRFVELEQQYGSVIRGMMASGKTVLPPRTPVQSARCSSASRTDYRIWSPLSSAD